MCCSYSTYDLTWLSIASKLHLEGYPYSTDRLRVRTGYVFSDVVNVIDPL